MKRLRFVGLDVHAEAVAVAVADPDGEVRSLGTIPNKPESVRRLVRKLGPPEQLRACHEAGPTGYVPYWQLAQPGVKCDVIAPTEGAKRVPRTGRGRFARGRVAPARGHAGRPLARRGPA